VKVLYCLGADACNGADVLEWTWFLNSFSDGHIYDFVYGDKDTYGVAFALAGKAHMYQHMNTPPGAYPSAVRFSQYVCSTCAVRVQYMCGTLAGWL
jgi:hypothetical protein